METTSSQKEGSMFVPQETTYGAIMKLHKIHIADFEDTILKYTEASVKLMHNKQVIVADFCTADGEIFLSLLEKIINVIKRKKEETEILVVFEDKEDNNYNALFKTLLKDKPLLETGIFTMASATTMYKQCLPSNSTQFIFCFNSIHYLSKRPCLIKNSMLTTDCSPEEQKIYQQQAADDWKLFLKHRSKELNKGGVLFIITSSETYPDYGQLNVALRSLFKDKLISEKEFFNVSLQSYIRTEKEFQQPFDELAEQVRDLEIVSMDVCEHLILEAGSDINRNQKTRTITSMVKTWSYHAVFNHLDTDRTDEDRQQIVHEFYKRYSDLVENMTGDFLYKTQRIVIKKKL